MELPVADVVIVGAGASGLTAAIRARDAGREVLVLEKTDKYGGTTAISAGALWIPNNSLQQQAGIEDSKEDAATYLTKVALGQASPDLIRTYIDRCAEMIDYLQGKTQIRFMIRSQLPDYHAEWEGGKRGGRSLEPQPFDGNLLGDLAGKIRVSAAYRPVTNGEMDGWGPTGGWDRGLIEERSKRRILTVGPGLVAGLLLTCVDRSVRFLLEARVVRLIEKGGRVIGVTVERGGEAMSVMARRAVILACGGFAWNEEMKTHFLRGPDLASATIPADEGDGIRMGVTVGAKLLNMNEAWWSPVIRIPREQIDGRPAARMVVKERTCPGSIMVNRAGRRFCNEAQNYHDLVRAFHFFDPQIYGYPNVPAFLIFDEAFRRRYSIGPVLPSMEVPPWIKRGGSPRELADALGIVPEGLEKTIETFNVNVRRGIDPEFHRGESIYDSAKGDKSAKHPCLAPLDTPPFHGFEVLPGDIGTKGGLAINGKAQVLNVDGQVIPGLYAAGNVTASVMGAGYAGGGATLGPAMTFGYLAGMNAAEEPLVEED